MIYYNPYNFFKTIQINFFKIYRIDDIFVTISFVAISYIFVILQEIFNWNISQYNNEVSGILDIYNFFLAAVLSFRLDSAFKNCKDGINNVNLILNEASNIIIHLFSIVDEEENKTNIIKILENDIYDYISVIFFICRGSNGRNDEIRNSFIIKEINDGIVLLNELEIKKNEKETNNKYKIIENNFYGKEILAIIEFKIRKRFNELKINSLVMPQEYLILNNYFTCLSTSSNNLLSICNIPIIHRYNQFINIFIILYLILYTLILVPESKWLTGIWVFIWAFILLYSNSVANEIDNSFGTENNDIEIEILYKDFKKNINHVRNKRKIYDNDEYSNEFNNNNFVDTVSTYGNISDLNYSSLSDLNSNYI